MIAQTAAQASAVRAHEELFAYWASRRRGAELPARRDIDPAGFKRLLPTVSLVDVIGDPPKFRLRLAGTGLYGVFGREITGLSLDEVYPPTEAAAWRERFEKVVRTGKPAAGVSSLAWRGAARTALVWIRLPLASDGTKVDMILGYDALVGHRDEPPSGVRAA